MSDRLAVVEEQDRFLVVREDDPSDWLPAFGPGAVAGGGYLLYVGLLPAGPQAIAVTEQILHRQMGPSGRELVGVHVVQDLRKGSPLELSTVVGCVRVHAAQPDVVREDDPSDWLCAFARDGDFPAERWARNMASTYNERVDLGDPSARTAAGPS